MIKMLLVWFLFYGPSTHFRSFRARTVNLDTLFLGKPSRQFTSTYCTFFRLCCWQLLFLNQRKREESRRNVFMTKYPRNNVPDVGIELGAASMPSELASDLATAPGLIKLQHEFYFILLSGLMVTAPQKSYAPLLAYSVWLRPCT